MKEQHGKNKNEKKIYRTVDPAPSLSSTNIEELKGILLDENRSLFERYRAMFALRDIGTDEAVLTICEGHYFILFLFSIVFLFSFE